MKKLTFAKSLATVGLAAVCVVGVAGCSDANSAGSEGSGETTYTGGVAATVNGAEIQEDTVTQSIQSIREQMGVTDEQSWGEWLAQYDYTPESVREEIINTYVDQELLKQGAAAQEITADEGEVNQYIEKMRSNYESDEKWNEALAAVGMTEDEYRENIELSLVTQQLKTNLAAEAGEATDEEVLETAKSYASSYSGAKKSSHILFDAADEDQAKEVLEQVRSGELDFAEAAKTYSKDTGSAEDGGNVGWDKLSNFVSEYTDALEGLEKDQISDLVSSEHGLHIIKCTDVFTAPEELTSLDQLPTEFQDSIRSMVQSSKESQAYYTWLEEQREAADIKINDMPEGLPYYVDMTKYAKDDEEGAAAEGEPVASTDSESAAGETAEGDQQTGEGTDAAEGTEGDTAEPAESTEGAESGDAKPAGDTDAAAADQQPAEADASAESEQSAEITDQPAEAPASE